MINQSIVCYLAFQILSTIIHSWIFHSFFFCFIWVAFFPIFYVNFTMAMHRYLTGAAPSPPKKTKPSLSDLVYEKRRKRNFQDKWVEEYPWLYMDEAGKMFWRICVESKLNAKSSFVQWSESYRHDSIRKHAETDLHIKLERAKTAHEQPVQETESGRILSEMRVADTDRMSKLSRMSHALELKGRPYLDYVWMGKLAKKLGTINTNEYINDKQARTYTHYIAEVERKQVVRKTNKFTIIQSTKN